MVIAYGLLLLCACQSEPSTPVSYSEDSTITLNPTLSAETLPLDSVVASVRYVPLGSELESILTNPRRIMLWEEFMVVFDRIGPEEDRGVLFTIDGQSIGPVGKQGRGPGEYNHVTDVCINPFTHTVDILCNAAGPIPLSILQYDLPSLAYRRTIGIADGNAQIFQFMPLDTHQYLFYHPSYEIFNPAWNFVFSRFDTKEQKMLNQISPLPEAMAEGKAKGEITKMVWEAFTGDLAHPIFTNWNLDTVYAFDQDQNFMKEHTLAFEGAEYERLIYGGQERYNQLYKEGKVCCIHFYTETKNFVYGIYLYETFWGVHFLYSKRTGKLVQFSNDGLVNPFNGLEFILPLGSHYERDEIIFAAVPSRLHGQLAKNGDSFLPEAREALQSLTDTVSPDDNHVLIFYKFRD